MKNGRKMLQFCKSEENLYLIPAFLLNYVSTFLYSFTLNITNPNLHFTRLTATKSYDNSL